LQPQDSRTPGFPRDQSLKKGDLAIAWWQAEAYLGVTPSQLSLRAILQELCIRRGENAENGLNPYAVIIFRTHPVHAPRPIFRLDHFSCYHGCAAVGTELPRELSLLVCQTGPRGLAQFLCHSICLLFIPTTDPAKTERYPKPSSRVKSQPGAKRVPRIKAATPAGVDCDSHMLPGGIAGLNPRLMAGIPTGWLAMIPRFPGIAALNPRLMAGIPSGWLATIPRFPGVSLRSTPG
jgi:hypothetical protein